MKADIVNMLSLQKRLDLHLSFALQKCHRLCLDIQSLADRHTII